MPVSGIMLILIVGFCFVGPLITGVDANDQDPLHAFAGVSPAHLLGTDELGRDMVARLMAGGRLSLTVVTGSVLVALVVGTIWGLLAAGWRGWLDEVLMRTADIAMAIPQILFALICVAGFGASLVSLTLITGLILTPSTARMARAAVLQEMSLAYYAAGIAAGTRRLRLLVLDILPNTAPSLANQAVINAASAMILEASLSFVGLGVQPPNMSWGVLLQQGYSFLFNAPLYAVGPAAFILLTVLCLNLFADRIGRRTDGGRT